MIIDVPFVNIKMKLFFTYFGTIYNVHSFMVDWKQCLNKLQIMSLDLFSKANFILCWNLARMLYKLSYPTSNSSIQNINTILSGFIIPLEENLNPNTNSSTLFPIQSHRCLWSAVSFVCFLFVVCLVISIIIFAWSFVFTLCY